MKGPSVLVKAKLRRWLGDSNVRKLKRIVGRDRFDEVRLLQRVFQERGDTGTMVDVGAHFGIELAMFAELDWRVIAFEPDHANRHQLEASFGDHPNVTIDSRAVSDAAADQVAFFSSDQSSGISGLSAFHESHRESAKVSVTTMAEVVQEHALDRIDFLKVDVEGFDFFVVKGVDWDGVAPDTIVCEFEDTKTRSLGYTVGDMIDYLQERGYSITLSEWFPVAEYGGQHGWKKFTADVGDIDPKGWGNLIAFRDKPEFAMLAADRISELKHSVYG
ncbi:MAG: FkbM family methyltransferase [Sphingorhabdus sp.]